MKEAGASPVSVHSFVSVGQMKVADAFPESTPTKLRVSESKLEKHFFPLKVCPLSLVSVGQNESSRCFP